MNQPREQFLRDTERELAWLRREMHRRPAPWVLSRVAELEGMVAAHREEAARAITREAMTRLARKD